MRFPTLHVVPKCVAASCGDALNLERILNDPPIVRVPVVDEIGIQYGFDLQLTEGAYLLAGFLLLWVGVLRPAILELARRRRD